jgi:hypothetical protein
LKTLRRAAKNGVAVLLSVLVLLTIVLSVPIGPIRAVSVTAASVVYVDPVSKGGPQFESNGLTFVINVRLNLTAGEVMNEFDVRLNYTNSFVILKADSVNSAGNVFASYSGTTVRSCIDAVARISGGCESGTTPDTTGQVHVAQVILGQTISGPITAGLLFSIQFHVIGNGTSILSFDRANLIDPVGADPSKPNPHFNYALKNGGVFANIGLVAFYNANPTSSAAFLPGQQVLFDAGGSFDANNTGIAIAAYSWDFGDGSTSLLTQSVASHFFMRPGTYPVSLIVSTSGSQGVKSTAYIRVVVIVPALGSIILALRDSSGLGLSDPVTIQLFNASISTPSVTKTSQGVVTFDQLSPGQYTLKFSGPTVESYSKLEKVGAGLPTQDTIYLTLIPAPPDYGTILFFASLVLGVSLLSVFIVVRQIRSRPKAKKKRAP